MRNNSHALEIFSWLILFTGPFFFNLTFEYISVSKFIALESNLVNGVAAAALVQPLLEEIFDSAEEK